MLELSLFNQVLNQLILLSKNIFIYSNKFNFLSTQASSVWGQKHNKHTLNENCHLFIKWRSHKIHILEEIVIDTLNDTQKKIPQNHTQILYYKNCPSKMGENIYTRKYCRTIPPIIAFVHTHKPANGKKIIIVIKIKTA